tara:strand:+ start:227 stop:523 length:297 start_codon:yes stop_codon:yes gene_type:complete
MKNTINTISFSANKKLVDFINIRVKKLSLFYNHILSSKIFLKIDRKRSISNKITEIKINVPGGELFACKKSNSFEQSFRLAILAIQKQIKKYKKKNNF